MGDVFIEKEKQLKVILNSEVTTAELLLVSKLIIDIISKNEIHHCLWGGELLIYYINNIVKKIASNKELIPLYLIALSEIYVFIKKEDNRNYLTSTGMSEKTYYSAKRVIIKAIKSEKWNECICRELENCTLDEYIKIRKVSKMCGIKICNQIINKSLMKDEISWRYLCYIIDLGNDEEQKKAFNIFKNKADIVNIRYPLPKCDEYIFLIRLYNSVSNYSKEYEEIVELGMTTNNPKLFLSAAKVFFRWGKDYVVKIDKEKIKEFISKDDVKDDVKKDLNIIRKIIEEQEGIGVGF